MAPPHRLAVELSDQTESISQLKQTKPSDIKETSQESQITAKRFSATSFIIREIGGIGAEVALAVYCPLRRIAPAMYRSIEFPQLAIKLACQQD
jgi:hypothetical protein